MSGKNLWSVNVEKVWIVGDVSRFLKDLLENPVRKKEITVGNFSDPEFSSSRVKEFRKLGFVMSSRDDNVFKWYLFLNSDDKWNRDRVIGQEALVIFSGGQDSTTCLYWALQRFKKVYAVHFDYGQRHQDSEYKATRNIVSLLKVPITYLHLDIFSQLSDSLLLEKEGDISSAHRSRNDLPASFVPGRNLIFISTAAALAYKLGITNLVAGVCQNDLQGYPDCRQPTIEALEKALQLGMDYPFRIYTPLIQFSKKETVLWAQEIPGCIEGLGFSISCYNGKNPPCGECPACIGRAKGFAEAGIEDPIFMSAKTRGDF